MTVLVGKTLKLPQENGPDVELIAFGNESYGRLETLQGYTAIYDEELGLYTYADLAGGEYISTGISISEDAPSNLQMRLKESLSVKERKASARFNWQKPGEQ